MVDIWMLFSLVLPFADVVLQTYSYLLSQQEEGEKKVDDGVARVGAGEKGGDGLTRVRVGVTTLAVSNTKQRYRYINIYIYIFMMYVCINICIYIISNPT
jgi:hypothetical protein